MRELEGMLEAFRRAKVVFLATFSETGERRVRPMVNFNENPYEMMWFSTFKNTRKVEDIKKNPRVLISFASLEKGKYYEIEGRAEFEDEKVTEEKWRWWYLYLHPETEELFWHPGFRYDDDKIIINVYPISAKVVEHAPQKS